MAGRWRRRARALGVPALRHRRVVPRGYPCGMDSEHFLRIVERAGRARHAQGAVFRFERAGEAVEAGCGNLSPGTRFHIASIDKLVIGGLLTRMAGQGRLALDDALPQHLPERLWRGLARLDGRDVSASITLRHLLGHGSGLPCYLEDRNAAGGRNMHALLRGEDVAWPLEAALDEVRAMPLRFAPGAPGRAHYADTNFRLLGAVVAAVRDEPLDAAFSALFAELGMAHSACLHRLPVDVYAPVAVPGGSTALRAFGASTGSEIASTCGDLVTLLRAWFAGAFHPRKRLHELQQWRPIFFPLEYGLGVQRFRLPRWLSPLSPPKALIGHAGSTGSVLFHAPAEDAWIAGTINLAGRPQPAFRAMLRMLGEPA